MATKTIGSVKKPGTYKTVRRTSGVVGKGGGVIVPSKTQPSSVVEKVQSGGSVEVKEPVKKQEQVTKKIKERRVSVSRSSGRIHSPGRDILEKARKELQRREAERKAEKIITSKGLITRGEFEEGILKKQQEALRRQQSRGGRLSVFLPDSKNKIPTSSSQKTFVPELFKTPSGRVETHFPPPSKKALRRQAIKNLFFGKSRILLGKRAPVGTNILSGKWGFK